VDDNVDSAELVARIAGKCGYETQVATAASEIRSAIADWRPDYVALDLSMPELNGLDLGNLQKPLDSAKLRALLTLSPPPA
jgi:CheY-like chemotaxis protein